MQELSLIEYRDLTAQAKPLVSEVVNGNLSHKVLQLPDKSILKLFRLKRFLTSARLFPYAKRFHRNSAQLRMRGISTVSVTAVYTIPAIKRTAVHYRFLAGTTLRDHCAHSGMDPHLAKHFGCFFAYLHQHGIYFRSIHFGNVLVLSGQQFALIDVADMRFRRKSLNMRMRIRNLRHLFRYAMDVDCLAPVRDVFMDAYCTSSQMRPHRENHIRRRFESYFRAPTLQNASFSPPQGINGR